jgi:hypothetical protein
MRVIEQLINHLRGTGDLTPDQLAQLRRMGLLKHEDVDHTGPGAGDSVAEEGVSCVESDGDLDLAEDWEAYGDRLLDVALSEANGRRRGVCRRAAACDMAIAVERVMAQEQGFLEVVFAVARRINPTVDADDAPRVILFATPAVLDAVLARDDLWAELWPYIDHEPIFCALEDRVRRRLYCVPGADERSDQSVPRPGLADRVLRHAADLIGAHRVLSGAFGRVALTIDGRRAFDELNLRVDPMTYGALVILFSARTAWRTIADLPYLAADVGLPNPAWLRSPQFESGWAMAARIDPVAVLRFKQWCVRAWEAAPTSIAATCRVLHFGVNGPVYMANLMPESASEWFSLRVTASKWGTLRCITHVDAQPGQPTQSIIRDGVEYLHFGPIRADGKPRRFKRKGADEFISMWWSKDTVSIRALSRCRGNYGAMWAAGLFDMPVLTCPKEWELL